MGREAVTQALADLHEARLISFANTAAGVAAVDPSLAIDAFVARKQREVAAKPEALAAVRTQIPTLADVYALARAKTVEQVAFGGRRGRVLELVAAGNKDERIARSLGVGTRTIRRDIAELKNQLGAASRAEIVTAAIKRGLL